MEVIEYKWGDTPKGIGKTVLALGFFDGVHLGHRLLIEKTVKEARRLKITPAVFTFSAESESLKRGEQRIYPTKAKLKIFESLGIQLVILADFASVSGLSPEEFIESTLVRDLGCEVAVFGLDFRFGYRAAGDASLLERKMKELSRKSAICDIECVTLEGGEREKISSRGIRALLSLGKIEDANKLLGEPYHTYGGVLHGRGDGRTFGYPTANTSLEYGTPLSRGVYITRVKIGENLYTGLSNVGVCPTFGERDEHIETFIFDFDGDVYGEDIRIDFLKFLRAEHRFSCKEELTREIEKNIAEAREYIKWQEAGQS